MAQHDSTFENSSLNDMIKNASDVKFTYLVNKLGISTKGIDSNEFERTDDTNTNKTLEEQIREIDAIIARKNQELNQTNNTNEQNAIREEISLYEIDKIQLQDIQTNIANDQSGKKAAERDLARNNRSMFDKYAFIDYRRFRSEKHYEDPQNIKDLKERINEIVLKNKGGYEGNTINQEIQGSPNSGFTVPYKGVEGGAYSDLTIDKIIKWSENFPQLQLRYQDFVYCKELGNYPTNRLVVLRKFKNAVPDNLFDYHRIKDDVIKDDPFGMNIQPISTLVTWADDASLDKIELTFAEQWKPYAGGSLKDIFLSSDKSGGLFGSLKQGKAGLLDTAIIRNLLDKIDKNGKDFEFDAFEDPTGNPNLIMGSHLRETGGAGISGGIKFSFDFNYEMRYINGVDPGIAMMELMANCIKMGTRRAEFLAPFDTLDLNENEKFRQILEGDDHVKMVDLFEGLKKTIEDSFGLIESVFTDFSAVLTNTGDLMISRYREVVKAALASATGAPSGVYHITIGNPIVPYVSCGDLVITSDTTLKMGKELGYNDFPTSFSYKLTVKTARNRGSQELIRIFNSGRGRFYIYEKQTQDPDNWGSKKLEFDKEKINKLKSKLKENAQKKRKLDEGSATVGTNQLAQAQE